MIDWCKQQSSDWLEYVRQHLQQSQHVSHLTCNSSKANAEHAEKPIMVTVPFQSQPLREFLRIWLLHLPSKNSWKFWKNTNVCTFSHTFVLSRKQSKLSFFSLVVSHVSANWKVLLIISDKDRYHTLTHLDNAFISIQTLLDFLH